MARRKKIEVDGVNLASESFFDRVTSSVNLSMSRRRAGLSFRPPFFRRISRSYAALGASAFPSSIKFDSAEATEMKNSIYFFTRDVLLFFDLANAITLITFE